MVLDHEYASIAARIIVKGFQFYNVSKNGYFYIYILTHLFSQQIHRVALCGMVLDHEYASIVIVKGFQFYNVSKMAISTLYIIYA